MVNYKILALKRKSRKETEKLNEEKYLPKKKKEA